MVWTCAGLENTSWNLSQPGNSRLLGERVGGDTTYEFHEGGGVVERDERIGWDIEHINRVKY